MNTVPLDWRFKFQESQTLSCCPSLKGSLLLTRCPSQNGRRNLSRCPSPKDRYSLRRRANSRNSGIHLLECNFDLPRCFWKSNSFQSLLTTAKMRAGKVGRRFVCARHNYRKGSSSSGFTRSHFSEVVLGRAFRLRGRASCASRIAASKFLCIRRRRIFGSISCL